MGVEKNRGNRALPWLALFGSSGTLICCALPIILVTLGAGATVAALTSELPFLITLSEYKLWVFIGSGVVLALALYLQWRPARQCPGDAQLGAACATSQVWNRRVLLLSVILWVIGFFFAFLLFPLMLWWEGG